MLVLRLVYIERCLKKFGIAVRGIRVQNRGARTFASMLMNTNCSNAFEPADPVLSDQELLEIDPGTAMFVRVDTGKPLSLAERQRALSDIRLLLSVPEAVRRTFRLAKRLFLFGYFEYGFFTISEHYAFLALEAAIYCRWAQTLPPEVTVQVPLDAPLKMSRPTHQWLYEWRAQTGRKLKVEGESFPNSTHKILAKFEQLKVIEHADRERIEAALGLRNDLSHLESASITNPSLDLLEITAGYINQLFRWY